MEAVMIVNIDEKKEKKREYDKIYRTRNKESLKKKKAEYFQRTYNPEKEALRRRTEAYRKKHRDYCARESYKNNYKKEYDAKYRAKKEFGEMDEVAMITLLLKKEIRKKATAYEIRIQNGYYKRASKAQRERKKHGKIKCSDTKGPIMGNLDPG